MTRIFFRGLFGILPVVLALWFLLIDLFVAAEVVDAAAGILESVMLSVLGTTPDAIPDGLIWRWFFSWGSYVAAVTLVLFPLLAASIWMETRIGRAIHAHAVRWLRRVPLFDLAYLFSHAARKKLDAEYVKQEFRSVVIVPVTDRGDLSLGIVTGEVQRGPDGTESVWVLIPSSPFSLASRLLLVSKSRTRPTALPIEGVFRNAASLGLMQPDEPISA